MWPNARGVDVSSAEAQRIYNEDLGSTYAGACSGALLNARDLLAEAREALAWVLRYESGLATVGPYPPTFKNCADVLAKLNAELEAK